MNTKLVLSTLCIATLAACAVDNSEQQAAMAEAEQRKKDNRTEERVRELTGQTMNDGSVIVAMPAPSDDKTRLEIAKTSPGKQQNGPTVLAERSREYDQAVSAKHRNDNYLVMQQPQSTPSLASTIAIQNNIQRHV